jgi:hypothetical protein
VKRNFQNTIAVISLLAGAARVYAQGLINWGDYDYGTTQPNFSISIISPNPAQPGIEQTGNTSWDFPPGSANYGGGWIGWTNVAPGGGIGPTPADGPGGYNYQLSSNFEVGLYVATSLSALSSAITFGTPVATTNINSGALAGRYGNPDGQMIVAVPDIAAGTPVFVGIAAWYNGGGASNYAAAVASVTPCGYVESTNSVALGGGPPPPTMPPDLGGIGLTSFSLVGGPLLSPPAVSTQPATAVDDGSATLNATVDPGDSTSTFYFGYGTTTNYSSYTGMTTIPIGTSHSAYSNTITGLSPGTLYHYQAYAYNHDGQGDGGDLTFTTSALIGTPPTLTGAQWLGAGVVRFSFTNNPDATFTVLSATNLSLPLTNWAVMGAPSNVGSGVFQFTSQPTTNDATRFYTIRSP